MQQPWRCALRAGRLGARALGCRDHSRCHNRTEPSSPRRSQRQQCQQLSMPAGLQGLRAQVRNVCLPLALVDLHELVPHGVLHPQPPCLDVSDLADATAGCHADARARVALDVDGPLDAALREDVLCVDPARGSVHDAVELGLTGAQGPHLVRGHPRVDDMRPNELDPRVRAETILVAGPVAVHRDPRSHDSLLVLEDQHEVPTLLGSQVAGCTLQPQLPKPQRLCHLLAEALGAELQVVPPRRH
eukprot:10009437-Lingulodinium_polyedra.AAC.1